MAGPAPVEVKTVTLSTTAGIPEGTKLETPPGMPDIVVKTKSPFMRTLTRIARVYVNSLVGMLSVVLGNLAPNSLIAPPDFIDKFLLAAGLALAPAVWTLLTNAAEVLAKLDAQT